MEQYFYEAFQNLKRLGPGSEESTLRALKYIKPDKNIKILDVACGVGTHTFILAKHLPNATIIAIDNNQKYINQLNLEAQKAGLSNRVIGKCMSMFEMDFAFEDFDCIYSEGGIYIAGFSNGLKDWKKYLKPNGTFICSEISWIKDEPSKASKEFWCERYPQIDNVENKVKIAEKIGYSKINTFICPKADWLDNYYLPLEKNLKSMQNKYQNNNEAIEVINMIKAEIDLYKNNSDDYSYVFYVLENSK